MQLPSFIHVSYIRVDMINECTYVFLQSHYLQKVLNLYPLKKYVAVLILELYSVSEHRYLPEKNGLQNFCLNKHVHNYFVTRRFSNVKVSFDFVVHF